jgi:hypothetical protein
MDSQLAARHKNLLQRPFVEILIFCTHYLLQKRKLFAPTLAQHLARTKKHLIQSRTSSHTKHENQATTFDTIHTIPYRKTYMTYF